MKVQEKNVQLATKKTQEMSPLWRFSFFFSSSPVVVTCAFDKSTRVWGYIVHIMDSHVLAFTVFHIQLHEIGCSMEIHKQKAFSLEMMTAHKQCLNSPCKAARTRSRSWSKFIHRVCRKSLPNVNQCEGYSSASGAREFASRQQRKHKAPGSISINMSLKCSDFIWVESCWILFFSCSYQSFTFKACKP